jgi:hypothetical protein
MGAGKEEKMNGGLATEKELKQKCLQKESAVKNVLSQNLSA